MIESIVNIIQIVFTGLCTALAVQQWNITKKRSWIFLGAAEGVYFLSDIYWQLYMIFYGRTPQISNIPNLGWYACYLFLFMMMYELGCCNIRFTKPQNRLLWLIPLFAVGAGVFFYTQDGDIIGNIISGVLMTMLIWSAAEGLLKKDTKKSICIAVLLFCAAEYGSWISSCFFTGSTLANPYLWFDMFLSATFLLLPAALAKAVRA